MEDTTATSLAPPASEGIRGYDIIKPIGKGKFATVFKATRLADGSVVALKKVQVGEMDEKARNKALKEVRLVQSLNHPNVVQYLDSFLEGNELVIALEWAAAGDLKRQIRKAQEKATYFEERVCWKYFSQIADALRHMHARRIMHRDLKPANIFLTLNGTVKVGDLGLGRELSDNTLEAHSKVGTPLYMSPEVLRGGGYDFSSDVWSVGCLLYELAMLKSPFKSEGLNLYSLFQKISKADYPLLPSHFSEELKDLAYSCLIADDPKARPLMEAVCEIASRLRQRSSEEAHAYMSTHDGQPPPTVKMVANASMPSASAAAASAAAVAAAVAAGNTAEEEEGGTPQQEFMQQQQQQQQQQQRLDEERAVKEQEEKSEAQRERRERGGGERGGAVVPLLVIPIEVKNNQGLNREDGQVTRRRDGAEAAVATEGGRDGERHDHGRALGYGCEGKDSGGGVEGKDDDYGSRTNDKSESAVNRPTTKGDPREKGSGQGGVQQQHDGTSEIHRKRVGSNGHMSSRQQSAERREAGLEGSVSGSARHGKKNDSSNNSATTTIIDGVALAAMDLLWHKLDVAGYGDFRRGLDRRKKKEDGQRNHDEFGDCGCAGGGGVGGLFSPRGPKILPCLLSTHFALPPHCLPSNGVASGRAQFLDMVHCAHWLLDTLGLAQRYFDYGGDAASFAPPPSLCRALLLAAGAAGLPSHLVHAITPSTLATAHGTAVIELLTFLVDQVLLKQPPDDLWRSPSYPSAREDDDNGGLGDDGGGATDASAAVLGDEDDDGIEDEVEGGGLVEDDEGFFSNVDNKEEAAGRRRRNNGDVSIGGGRGGMMMQRMIWSEVDGVAWLLEVERVGPQLKKMKEKLQQQYPHSSSSSSGFGVASSSSLWSARVDALLKHSKEYEELGLTRTTLPSSTTSSSTSSLKETETSLSSSSASSLSSSRRGATSPPSAVAEVSALGQSLSLVCEKVRSKEAYLAPGSAIVPISSAEMKDERGNVETNKGSSPGRRSSNLDISSSPSSSSSSSSLSSSSSFSSTSSSLSSLATTHSSHRTALVAVEAQLSALHASVSAKALECEQVENEVEALSAQVEAQGNASTDMGPLMAMRQAGPALQHECRDLDLRAALIAAQLLKFDVGLSQRNSQRSRSGRRNGRSGNDSEGGGRGEEEEEELTTGSSIATSSAV